MKAIYLNAAGALALTFTIAACVPSVEPPLPAPTPAATPAATPSPAPAPAPVVRQPEYENYLDAPQTPGDWVYLDAGSTSQADFTDKAGDFIFRMSCQRAPGRERISIIRKGYLPARSSTITIKTETTERTLPADVSSSAMIVATSLDANDPLLDAMAITKGRFAVETPGLPTLYIPAWVEVSRVIEDCR